MRIVLIADDVVVAPTDATLVNRQVDRINHDYVEQISDAIRAAGHEVVLYTSPAELIRNVDKHRDDLVFPYWQGSFSKNRHALGPAICEAAGLKYIGGDTFAKSICNDKHLTKLLCRDLGLSTPPSVAVRDERDLSLMNRLALPFVVKPMFEGSSLGITQRNLVTDVATARVVATELLQEFGGPIIAEEFAPGREVSICMIGYGDHVTEWAAGERYVLEDESFLHDHLYAFDAKYVEEHTLGMRDVKHEISPDLYQKCRRLFHYLDKVEYVRIDGKLTDDDFQIIELTPESHLGKNAEFCGPFIAGGRFSFEDVIALLIDNALARYRHTVGLRRAGAAPLALRALRS